MTISKIAIPLKVGTAIAAEIAGVCGLIFCECLCVKIVHLCINRILDNGWSLRVELGCAKHFSHNIVDVFVGGVACDRSMDKRVCDWFQKFSGFFRGSSGSCPRRL